MSESQIAPLCLSRLELRQFAGVHPETAFTLSIFSPQINIIFGPNGCGKTTTATAIQNLIWATTSQEHADLNATLQQADSTWRLQRQGREVTATREGLQVPHPAWAAAETRSRYHWSLQNLLQDQDQDLARQIAREMAGGIDFQELASALDWQKKPSAPLKLHQQYLEAEKRVREAKEKQQAIFREASTLDSLRHQLHAAMERYAQSEALQQAMEMLEKQEAFTSVSNRLQENPAGMEHLQGDDASQLERLLNAKAESEKQLRQLHQQRKALGRGVEDWAMVDLEAFRNARKLIQFHEDTLKNLRNELRDADIKVSEAESREQETRAQLGIHAQATLGLEEGYQFPSLQEWIREVFAEIELNERKKMLSRRVPDLSTPSAKPSAELLREARQELDRWLKAQSSAPATSHAGLILSTLLLAGGIIALCVQKQISWFWILGILPAPLLQFLLNQKNREHGLSILEQNYQRLDVPQPESWQEESVLKTLQDLEGLIREVHAEGLVELDRRALAETEAEHQQVQQRIDQLQNTLSQAGLSPKADRAWLAHFLDNIQRWRNLRTETAVAEDTQHKFAEQLLEQEAQLTSLLKQWGEAWQNLPLSIAAGNCLERMENELERRKQMEFLDIQLRQQSDLLADKQQTIRTLCDRVGLADPDLAEVKHRVSLLGTWKKDVRESEILHNRLSELRKALGEQLPLADQSVEQLQAQYESCKAARETEREIRDRMSKLEQQISDQQHGRRLHEAEEALEDCREALLQERNVHLETRAGMEILEWLREQCKTRDRSSVLEEANRNLVLFSKGTLQLEVSMEEKDGAFQARRAGQPSLSLDRLSSGERSQVLMAVRLAFLRQVEQLPLPLLVDEALGTTDDERGEEIMRALIEVSRQGRQIFYFTAQHDEVNKWRTVLAEEGVEECLIDLAALRGLAETQQLSMPEPSFTTPTDYRRQESESWEDWAKRLSVSGWDPQQPLENLSLWYLLHKREDLLQTLFDYGIDRVGKWELYKQSGALNGWVNESELKWVSLQLQTLRRLQAAWKIGRPAPVPDRILAGSTAISEKFIDDVLVLNQQCHGNAAQLISALDQRQVTGFRQQKIRNLENELRELDYLSDQVPLNRDRVTAQVMGEMDPDEKLQVDWNSLLALIFLNAD